jgi:hypothetical protein
VSALGRRDVFDIDREGGGENCVALLGKDRDHIWAVSNTFWKAKVIERWRLEHATANYLREQVKEAGKKTDPAERDLEQAASLLTWETIRGSNLKPDEVTRDLNLVPQIGNGVALAWATDSPAVSAAGVMTRPDWNAGDVPVTLTATLTKAPAAAREVKFSVTVKKAAPPPVQVNAGVGGMTYTVNSQLVRFDGVTCFNAQRGISVMALRLFEQLGASFTYVWQPGGGVITMTYGGTTVVLRENSNQMTITDAVGTRTVTLRTAVVNRGGRAFIPTRDVSEYLGFNVVWNAADDSITITAK